MNRPAFEALDSFIYTINAAQNLDEILNILQNIIKSYGFDRFTYWLRWAEIDKEPIAITTYPENFVNRYIAKDYQAHDMVGRLSSHTNTPFVWTDISKRFEITKMQKVLFDESQSVGIQSGGSVPIHGPNQTQATFSVVSDADYKEFDKLFNHHRHELHIIAAYAHEKILSLGIDSHINRASLTTRETEVLLWVSRGKTYWEIGRILNIQEGTVKKYMQRIFDSLQVSNSSHAVAKAIINGLIIP